MAILVNAATETAPSSHSHIIHAWGHEWGCTKGVWHKGKKAVEERKG